MWRRWLHQTVPEDRSAIPAALLPLPTIFNNIPKLHVLEQGNKAPAANMQFTQQWHRHVFMVRLCIMHVPVLLNQQQQVIAAFSDSKSAPEVEEGGL